MVSRGPIDQVPDSGVSPADRGAAACRPIVGGQDREGGPARVPQPIAATDLLVVGGGPAGLATAIRARLAGLSVRVLERSRPAIDKACGEGLMPDAVLRLAELGIELPAAECHAFRGIRYLDGEVVAEGLFPRAGGLGVRRLSLHQALARRAAELGVDLWWGIAASGLAPFAPMATAAGLADPPRGASPPSLAPTAAPAKGRGRGFFSAFRAGAATFPAAGGPRPAAGRCGTLVRGVLTELGVVEARWVVGADGLHSRVRRWAGLEGTPARRRRFGVRRHYACRPWSDLVEVYWGPRCEAYVTPVGPREVGVAMLWSEGKTSFDALLTHFPALAARLAGATPSSRDRGAGPLRQRARAVWRGNVALVGDASGYLDAITGEGLAVALHQSAALVEALVELGLPSGRRRPARTGSSDLAAATPRLEPMPVVPAIPAMSDLPRRRRLPGSLTRYAAAHRRIGRLPATITALVLALERRPWLRRRAIRALAAEPALFSRLLGIHARALPPSRLGIDGALRLVYRLVIA